MLFLKPTHQSGSTVRCQLIEASKHEFAGDIPTGLGEAFQLTGLVEDPTRLIDHGAAEWRERGTRTPAPHEQLLTELGFQAIDRRRQ